MLLKIMQLAILPFCHQINIRANKSGPEEDSDAVDRNKVIQGFFFFLKSNLMCFRNLEMLDQLILLTKIYPPLDTER